MTSPQSRPSIAPPVFKGTPEESAAEWLTCYEHVASLNCWDSDTKVKFLYLALDGDAKKWYTTQLLTGAPSSWSDWAAKLKACFSSRHAAEIAYLRLQNRVQLPTESPEQYFYDVMQLCARVDPKMPEEDRLRHLLRGLQPATMEKMIISNPTTCADFLQILQRLSQATLMSLASWLLPTPVSNTYLPTGAWNSNIHATPNSATTEPVPAPGQPHLLPACTAASYRQQQRLEGEQDFKAIAASLESLSGRLKAIEEEMFRNRVPWPPRTTRADDGRPRCHYCSRNGHISRQCRQRWRDEDREQRNVRDEQAPNLGNGNGRA
ncbi:hypothetical protein V5799_005785 [Amblyomma americanum]|uniref:CCHC-type domain-containing protein n=1 Tax=Amblyomma americanum TaxID=6943 RepID=A0AAQ4DY95_AMBAM